uniref:Uncharacterized protein n=1 Tax=Panagrolaimus sp. JU765 TaxID=591449 RepID=A0AC34QWI0_9BILA
MAPIVARNALSKDGVRLLNDARYTANNSLYYVAEIIFHVSSNRFTVIARDNGGYCYYDAMNKKQNKMEL